MYVCNFLGYIAIMLKITQGQLKIHTKNKQINIKPKRSPAHRKRKNKNIHEGRRSETSERDPKSILG